MTTATLGIVIAIVLYLALMLYLGFKFAKGNNTASDYYLGGRKLGPFVTAMSAEASDMSSWLLLGLPGVAYSLGICDAFWTAIGLGIGTYLNWLFVAKKLRLYTEKIDAVTIPQFFEKRFNDKSHLLMIISALVIVIFFTPYVASGFSACGKLFSSLFGINYMVAMIVSAVVIIAYTASGGFLAASTTDFVQSIVMSVALITVICFGVSKCGGVATINSYTGGLDGYISLTSMYDAASDSAVSYGGIITIISTLAWGLGYFGVPHVLLRFMAIEDPEKISLSLRISTVWVFIAMGCSIFIGIMAKTMSAGGALPAYDDAERSIIVIAQTLADLGFVPALLAGVIMAGILACTMSTCDSQLLAASSSISEDIINGVFGIKLDTKKTMLLARLTLLVIAVVAVFVARDPNSSVFGIVSFAWAGFGGAFGPIILLSLFWRRTNAQGAIAGMLSGGVTIFVWKFMVKPMGGVFGIYELLPSFLVALAFCVVVSLLTKEPEPSVYAVYDEISRKEQETSTYVSGEESYV